MKRFRPLLLIGMIFSLLGAVFAVLGGVLLIVEHESLPRLADPAIWAGDTPDELALLVTGAVFAVIGALFLLLGLVMLGINRRQRLLREELERFGVRVQGRVKAVRTEYSVRINGRSPRRIIVEAAHPITRERKTLRSPMLWEANAAIGDPIDVLFDPQDEKKHVIDL